MESIKSPLKRIKKSWEQQSNESDIAYHRFSVYLLMGPKRSMKKVGEKLGKKGGYEKQLHKWSSRHQWVERVGAYDEHLLRQTLSRKRDIVDLLMARLLQAGDLAIDALVDVLNMDNYYDSSMKSNASERIKAAEAVLDRIGLVRLTEADVEKTNGMSLYQRINQQFYGDKKKDESDE